MNHQSVNKCLLRAYLDLLDTLEKVEAENRQLRRGMSRLPEAEEPANADLPQRLQNAAKRVKACLGLRGVSRGRQQEEERGE